MELKLNISNPKDGSTITHTLEDAKVMFGKRIGEEFKGETIDKTGYVFKITGGSDNAGFPMRWDVDGSGRRKVLLAGGIGFNPKRKGIRSRRTIAGNTVGPNTAQVNITVIKAGPKPLIEPAEEPEQAAQEGGEQ